MESVNYLFEELTKEELKETTGGSTTNGEKATSKWIIVNGELVKVYVS